MSVKEHYDQHLGNFYSWMQGDFDTAQQEQEAFLLQNNLSPSATGVAIDLGAGGGLQSVSLARLGYQVLALDFNHQLLEELSSRTAGLRVEVFNEDLKEVKKYAGYAPELVVCCGDTISHLSSKEEIRHLLYDISDTLISKGRLLLTFRDYAEALQNNARFIPVKSDADKILTCFLEYFPETVKVTDLLYQYEEGKWVQKVSAYYKVRITSDLIKSYLKEAGFEVVLESNLKRMIALVAQKRG